MEFIIPWIMTVPKGTNLLSAYDFEVLQCKIILENFSNAEYYKKEQMFDKT